MTKRGVKCLNNLHLRLNLLKPIPTIEADPTQIHQIIMNLVINASEAIGEENGLITISTGVMECNKEYLQQIWIDQPLSEGLYVFIEIADNGCGMSKETVARIFDPFFTTKFTGRGLGMSAVLGIIRGHKGAIKVYSEPGNSTTIKILLPVGSTNSIIANRKEVSNDWIGRGTVLLVDDEKMVRDLGKDLLTKLGFKVLVCEDGESAFRIFKEHPEIDFVLLDLTMPNLDGEQTFKELRKIRKEIKVIMTSGYSEQEVTQKFAGKGITGFIQKPYKLSDLKKVFMKFQ